MLAELDDCQHFALPGMKLRDFACQTLSIVSTACGSNLASVLIGR
jgi:hypothetical protein